VLRSTTNLYKATEHTCTPRRAVKLIISKITKASYKSKRNAYKNKYTSKMIPTFSNMVSNPKLS
jgi:hypothetical protein